MHGKIDRHNAKTTATVEVISRDELRNLSQWREAFSGECKDHRYYEIVEDTIREGFDYGYFVVKDATGTVSAIQPFFILDQDMVTGINGPARRAVDFVRRRWPRFLHIRTLMMGCPVGEGYLDGKQHLQPENAKLLAASMTRLARALNASMIIIKEFPDWYRASLRCFLEHGFTRVPSQPMTCLNIGYANFEEYLQKVVGSVTRKQLRRKFRIAENSKPQLEMSVVTDVTSVADDIYALYLQVYNKSKIHFEKLTKEFFCDIGRKMPDKVRFFLWRQGHSIVAFNLCMVHANTIHDMYIGIDYNIAKHINLYYYTFRDVVTWAMTNDYKWYRNGPNSYDPKLHLRQALAPIDLYIKHQGGAQNIVLRRLLPFFVPPRHEKALREFSNYSDIW